MLVGHINLSESFNGAGEHFVGLIEALQKRGVQQYILVRNVALAKRLDLVADATVGPVVRSAISACCVLPHVDILHAHDRAARPAGLILKLTKSVPFVLNHTVSIARDDGPLSRATIRRASGIIDESQIDADEHLQFYRSAIAAHRAAAVSL